MNGYPPRQADERLAQLSAELRRYQKEALAAQHELAEAHRRVWELESPASARIEQLLQAAREQVENEAAKVRAQAERETGELRRAAERETDRARKAAMQQAEQVISAAEQTAAKVIAAAERTAAELRAPAERTAAELRAAAEQEVSQRRSAAERAAAELRAAAEHDITKQRALAEREAGRLKAATSRERNEILTAARRQAEEIRIREQRLLEHSEALRTQAESELEIELAARREESERQESEQHEAAVTATRKLVAEAERRAAAADKRAEAAIAQANQTRTDAEREARELISDAHLKGDQILNQAKEQADKQRTEAMADVERRRAAMEREVEELAKQRDDLAGHLAQMRRAFGAVLPDAIKAIDSITELAPWSATRCGGPGHGTVKRRFDNSRVRLAGMEPDADLAAVAGLIADRNRAHMLSTLLCGRPQSGSALAEAAGISRSLASAHLKKLVAGGLVRAERSGRQQLYSIAGQPVADALEILALFAKPLPVRSLGGSARMRSLRWARMCYDHLAGVVGVAVTEALLARDAVRSVDGSFVLGPGGGEVFGELGIQVADLRRQRRPLLRPCTDWTERRHHLAGGMGAALAGSLVQRGWIRPREGSRIITVPPAGVTGLRDWLGIDLERLRLASAA